MIRSLLNEGKDKEIMDIFNSILLMLDKVIYRIEEQPENDIEDLCFYEKIGIIQSLIISEMPEAKNEVERKEREKIRFRSCQ